MPMKKWNKKTALLFVGLTAKKNKLSATLRKQHLYQTINSFFITFILLLEKIFIELTHSYICLHFQVYHESTGHITTNVL